MKIWLIEKKGYSKRSAQDVESRINRVKKILGVEKITEKTIKKLEENESFKELSVSIKSQMRVAIRIYLEFKGECND